jgi:tRNA-2-methylthio-N6-dimethylallyladenosine synthase
MRRTDTPDDADLLLLNTCSVREKPQEKVFHQLGRWRQFKREHPDTLIAVGGCVASQEGAKLGERAPFVDLVFGPQTIHRLPELIEQALKRKTRLPVVDISFPEIEKFDKLPPPRTEGERAYLSIMEGCSRYCSFCVVPYTRGEEFSRPFQQILQEARVLAEGGVQEITLLGQNVNAYNDLHSESAAMRFSDLLYAIAQIPEIKRIRFTTSHPIVFGQDLIDAYADIPKLAAHLHLPVQSGSDRILAMMKRGYTALEYKHKIRALRKACADISISSDFIVGFPQESEEDFQATMQLVEDIGFDHSFCFLYSARPGTPAAALDDNVPLKEKKYRLSRLQTLLEQQAKIVAERMVGTTQNVLVEGTATRNSSEFRGRCENNRMVVFTATREQPAPRGFVPVQILDAAGHSLRGKLLENSAMMSA